MAESSSRAGNGASSDNEFSDSQFKVKDFLDVIHHKRKLLAILVSVALITVSVAHFLKPSYSVKSYLLVDSESENSGFQALLGSLGMNEGGPSYNESESEKFMLILRSSDFLQRLITNIRTSPEFNSIRPNFEKLIAQHRTMGLIRPRTDLNDVSDAKLIDIFGTIFHTSYSTRGIVEIALATPDPKLTVYLTNQFLDTAAKVFSEREERKLASASQYIQGKIQDTVGKMEETDNRMLRLSSKNADLSLLAPSSAIAERLLQLKSDIQKSVFTFEQNEKVIQSLQSRLQGHPEENPSKDPLTASLSSSGGDSTLYGLKKTITNLQTENSLLSIRIDTMKRGLKDLLKSNMALPKDEQSLTDLKRQKGLDYFVFDNLFKTHLQLEVKGLSLLNRIYPLQKVTDNEVYTTTRLFPKLTLIFLVATALGSLGIYGVHLLRPVARTRKDVEDMDLSFLGTIPKIGQQYFETMANNYNLCRFEIDSKESVSLKQVRSRLIYLGAHSGDQKRNIMSMLSYGNGEGKSFVSSNLAACFAYMGKKTLLVDFDLRRASLTRLFGMNSETGLCEYFDKDTPIDRLIEPEISKNLDFLAAGRLTARTTEVISNERIQALFDEIRHKYEYIVIDTAPILVAPESIAIAKETDFAILLATSWRTRLEYISESLREIRSVRNKAIHLILNKTSEVSNQLVSNYYYMSSSKKRMTEPPQLEN